MKNTLPETFPPRINVNDDFNPAIRLFGKRFIREQSILEYLAEFLSLVNSEKNISGDEWFSTPLPALDNLQNWPKETNLKYKLPIKLNLKLFAFLSSSRIDSRHEVHMEQYKKLIKKLEGEIKVSSGNKKDAIDLIEDFLCGFHGAGFNRAWCAQCFFPVNTTLLARETIWNESKVKKNSKDLTWQNTIVDFNKYYSVAKRNFMARGGELLYLQLCNAFSTKHDEIREFARTVKLDKEADLAKLHTSLQKGLQNVCSQYTSNIDLLANYIESLDEFTHNTVNDNKNNLSCEWCPQDSWQEGFLFAVEIKRLLSAELDPVERLQLLMTGCALQVLRSLCAQSLRYAGPPNMEANGSTLGYAWLFSPPGSPSRQQRLASQRNLQVIQGLIQNSIRHKELQKNAEKSDKKSKEALNKEADTKYGHKLFLSLGKKMGIIVPQTGRGARLIMTDAVLRYLVLVLLEPGQRCTYNEFLIRLYRHYGIAVEGEALADAISWSGLPANSSTSSTQNSWLGEMLRAGGFLTELSDACSIVRNIFGGTK